MISDEQSKMVQETAKAVGTLAELGSRAGAFVSKVIGKPAEQIGGILEDQIRFYRYKNLCSIADKVQLLQKKRKHEGKTVEIPPRLAIPMLESAALEDDDALQDIWARLIANATDPNNQIVIHPSFIEIAKQLAPDEAIILSICAKRKAEAFQFLTQQGSSKMIDMNGKMRLKTFSKIDYANNQHEFSLKLPTHYKIYIDNLARLQIIESTSDANYFYLTSFGKSFIQACTSV